MASSCLALSIADVVLSSFSVRLTTRSSDTPDATHAAPLATMCLLLAAV